MENSLLSQFNQIVAAVSAGSLVNPDLKDLATALSEFGIDLQACIQRLIFERDQTEPVQAKPPVLPPPLCFPCIEDELIPGNIVPLSLLDKAKHWGMQDFLIAEVISVDAGNNSMQVMRYHQVDDMIYERDESPTLVSCGRWLRQRLRTRPLDANKLRIELLACGELKKIEQGAFFAVYEELSKQVLFYKTESATPHQRRGRLLLAFADEVMPAETVLLVSLTINTIDPNTVLMWDLPLRQIYGYADQYFLNAAQAQRVRDLLE